MKNKEVVLITGCSTGIGRELCKVLFDEGYIVVATARKVETLKDLPASLKLPLDVTKTESIYSAINDIKSKFQRIDILINNAGFSLRGALEEINVEKAKDMFNVNVFGIINMIQAVVPEMRKNNSGKIINLGSISGKFAQPINGVYCASKFAVEALNDALRLELSSCNIQVTVIEPGAIKTNFFKTLANNSNDVISNPNSYYSNFYKHDIQCRGKQNSADPKKAAEDIVRIISKEHLRSRYNIVVPFMHSMLTHFPDSLKEYLLRKALD